MPLQGAFVPRTGCFSVSELEACSFHYAGRQHTYIEIMQKRDVAWGADDFDRADGYLRGVAVPPPLAVANKFMKLAGDWQAQPRGPEISTMMRGNTVHVPIPHALVSPARPSAGHPSLNPGRRTIKS